MASNKKLLWCLIIYIVILGTYLTFATQAIRKWRQNNIKNSLTVYITSTGAKYHKEYHYHEKNSSISLFEADEKGYSPCKVCHPPIAQTCSGKPGLYFNNWFIVSLLFSFTYLTICYWVNKKL